MDGGEQDKTGFMKKKGRKHVIHYNLKPSSTLLTEDALKQIITKYGGGKLPNREKTKVAPKNKHSPFGDFPPGYLPPKNQDYTLVDIESHQVAHNVTSGKDKTMKSINSVSSTTPFSSLKKVQQTSLPKLELLILREFLSAALDFIMTEEIYQS